MTDTPEWLVETIRLAQRPMSATPKSIADAVWFELHKRVHLELKEEMELRGEKMVQQMEFRLVDNEPAVTLIREIKDATLKHISVQQEGFTPECKIEVKPAPLEVDVPEYDYVERGPEGAHKRRFPWSR